ncbi:hypothetical protein DH2020_014354 [Rehmannia glutinosa]|uniref:UBN2 domain-containing protein n=1 Tax=Rehmannia glutinosa TaxID=99300 RepID=A0ABR0WX20_REHGL
MECFLQGCGFDIWNVVIEGVAQPTTKLEDGTTTPKPFKEYDENDKKAFSLNGKALNILHCSLTATDYNRIRGIRSAHEVWEKLETIYEGTKKVKQARKTMLVKDFENFNMHDGESISKMVERLDNIVNPLVALGKVISEEDKVTKVLNALPGSWSEKVTAITEAQNLETLKFDELIGNLLIYEVYLKEKKNSQPSTSKSGARKILLKA